MKRIKTLLATLSILALISCGGGGSGSGAGSMKNLFSVWINAQFGVTLDFTGYSFNTPRATRIRLNTGVVCDCTLTIQGTQSSGAMVVNACLPPSSTCLALHGGLNYVITPSSKLRITDSAGVLVVFTKEPENTIAGMYE